ncbi:polyketide cyclase [Nitrosopumilus sp.]|uniref:polyketide cyclase n=1 Tax=Nitrosopumilus sp. TaxID=2024843 RepID=UPI00292CD157|nr:polyketide cyclase [Nitrosopumilus sp.]
MLSNYENYQSLLPQHFPSVRVRSVRGNVAVVEEHMNLGEKELVIMTKHVTKGPELHEIFVIGGDAKGSHISQRFAEKSDHTKVTFTVNFKIGGKMKIAGIFGKKSNVKEDYGKIVDDFIKLAERT